MEYNSYYIVWGLGVRVVWKLFICRLMRLARNHCGRNIHRANILAACSPYSHIKFTEFNLDQGAETLRLSIFYRAV